MKRLTNSSVKDDFPAPPVPVIPIIGIFKSFDFSSIAFTNSGFSSEKFSTAEMILAMLVEFSKLIESKSLASTSFPVAKSDLFTKSSIIPCNPSSRPSSGE